MTYIPTKAAILDLPCPRHQVPAGTRCPPGLNTRADRAGCEVRLWLAQAVVGGRWPRPAGHLTGDVAARFGQMYTQALAAGMREQLRPEEVATDHG